MPWLEPFDWTYPPDMPDVVADSGGRPYLLWTADTTFSLYWITPNPDPDPPIPLNHTLFARQDFTVASGAIEAVGDPVLITDAPTGINYQGYVYQAQMGEDGIVRLETAEMGGS